MSAIRDAIYNRLNHSSITTLLAAPPAGRSTSIFHEKAPDNAVPPYVIFDKMSGRPDLEAMKGSQDQNDIWQVKGVTKGSADKAEDIADAIYDRLQDAPVAISGMETRWMRRTMDIDLWEVVEGDRWDYVGAQYRLIAGPV